MRVHSTFSWRCFVLFLYFVYDIVNCNSRGVIGAGQNVVSVAPIQVQDESMYPRFGQPIPNVTVTIGRDALLACVVENLRGFKVAWVRMDTQTILSIHHNIITQNPRISLSYNDHRTWYLHIKNVQETDRGWYMCQVNTDPMRSRQGYLQVVVPPSILDNATSTDLVVREGSDVALACRAAGHPEPYVMWRREDGADIMYKGESVNVVDGEALSISKVSRLHMGAYLCIASNGVPPSISKRVMLMVQFPPMLSIPNQLEGAYIGQDVSLECHTEAYPASINYWTTDRGDMIISELEIVGDKYEAVSMDSDYNKFMMLKIKNISKTDFGMYKCVAKNSLGETDGLIKLDEIPAPPFVPKTTLATILDNQTHKKKGHGLQLSQSLEAGFSDPLDESVEDPWPNTDGANIYLSSTAAEAARGMTRTGRGVLALTFIVAAIFQQDSKWTTSHRLFMFTIFLLICESTANILR